MQKLTVVRGAPVEKSYEQFLEERKQGVGGSDIADILGEGDYGCKKRFFLDRLGLLPPKDEKMKHHLERGKFLEAPVATLFAQRTNRQVFTIGTGHIKELPQIRANADRLQTRPERDGKGVLEIKVPSQNTFRKLKKEGFPVSWLLQTQYEMLCYGCEWGTIAAYWADGHELELLEIDRDHELTERIKQEVLDVWDTLDACKRSPVINGTEEERADYARTFSYGKPSDSKACAYCPGFELCHGARERDATSIRIDELAPVANDYVALGAQIKELEDARGDLKEQLKEALDKSPGDKLLAGQFSCTVRKQSRTSLDAKEVAKVMPESVFQACHKTVSFEVFNVKESKQ